MLAFSVLSCSFVNNKQKVDYKSTVSMPSLEIPPDLTGLDDSSNKALPGSDLGTRAAIARFKESGPLLDKVLPKISGVELKGAGDFYWLEVKQSPTELYEVIKSFWAEEGFTLEQDEPLLGIMKTEWLENKAGLLFTGDSFLSNIFSLFESSDKEDQYKVRLERGDFDDMSRVYLTQYGREFILVDNGDSGNTSTWQTRAPDPEVEIEMLSRLMLFLGLQDEQVKQQLAKIGKFPARAQLLKNDDGITTLLLKESLDRGWNRVMFQLDRLDVEFVSKNRADPSIVVRQKVDQSERKEEKGFFASLFSGDKKKEDTGITLTLIFDETSNNTTRINIVDSEGFNNQSKQANALLQYLFERLK